MHIFLQREQIYIKMTDIGKLCKMSPHGQGHLQLHLQSIEGKHWPHAYFRHLLQRGWGDKTHPWNASFSPLATEEDQLLGLDRGVSISSGETSPPTLHGPAWPIIITHKITGLRKMGSELEPLAWGLHNFRVDWCGGSTKLLVSFQFSWLPLEGKAMNQRGRSVFMSTAQGTSRRAP